MLAASVVEIRPQLESLARMDGLTRQQREEVLTVVYFSDALESLKDLHVAINSKPKRKGTVSLDEFVKLVDKKKKGSPPKDFLSSLFNKQK